MRGICSFLLGFCLWLSVVSAALSDSVADTLADVRQDLAILLIEMRSLQRELSTTSGASQPNRITLLERIAAIETELRRLTDLTEHLEFRIENIVRDGTARIETIERQICALEEGCEMGELGSTLPLGAYKEPEFVSIEDVDVMTITEILDFGEAHEALQSGDLQTAIEHFSRFIRSYPGGPRTQDAQFYLGEAYSQSEDYRNAARYFLEAYSENTSSTFAPLALYNMALALHDFEKPLEACLSLLEVTARYPHSSEATYAREKMQEYACS